jgi:plastocyanin
MRKKPLFVLSVLFVLGICLAVFFFRTRGEVPLLNPALPTPLPPPASPQSQPKIERVISYTDSGFSPSPLTLLRGEAVVFVNESSQNMWPASAMHPTHAVYPTVGGCLGSTFDACRSLAPGEEWSFTFEIAGSWGYHNHVNPSHFGRIVVQ